MNLQQIISASTSPNPSSKQVKDKLDSFRHIGRHNRGEAFRNILCTVMISSTILLSVFAAFLIAGLAYNLFIPSFQIEKAESLLTNVLISVVSLYIGTKLTD